MAAEGAGLEPLLDRLAVRLLRRAGLRPPAWLLKERAAACAAGAGRTAEAHVLHLLAAGEEAEWERLIEALRVGETRFFRHPEQLAVLRGALPAAAARARAEGRPLRAWSAGCSTGEEAWTLAMLLAEGRTDGDLRPEVLGTDRSAPALRAAAAGRYGGESARLVPPALALRFLRRDGDGVAVAPALREAVRVGFRRHDLLGARYPGPFDVILCRNVLIYLDEARRREIVERLRGSLAAEGLLVLGPGEEEVRAGPSTGASAPAGPVLTLSGGFGDGDRLRAALRPHLAARTALTIDLDGASFLGDEDARVLRRAAELIPLRLSARKVAVRRWLRRHQLLGEEG